LAQPGSGLEHGRRGDIESTRVERVFWRAVTRPQGAAMLTVFTVWIFKGDGTLECQFDEFADAKTFAKAAEKITDVKQVGVTNNESPEYLVVWTKPV
jgi:hypothetical protein